MEEKKRLFSNQDLRRLILPLVVDQFLQSFVGLADVCKLLKAWATVSWFSGEQHKNCHQRKLMAENILLFNFPCSAKLKMHASISLSRTE